MSKDVDGAGPAEALVRPGLPPCDCTAECGDDPAIARGTAAKCERWAAIHADPQMDLVLARSEADDYRRQRDDCTGCRYGEAFADSDLSAPECTGCVGQSHHSERPN